MFISITKSAGTKYILCKHSLFFSLMLLSSVVDENRQTAFIHSFQADQDIPET